MWHYSIVELVGYGIMLALIAVAIAHRSEARSRRKRAAVVEARLNEVASYQRNGGEPAVTLASARAAAGDLALAGVFEIRPSRSLLVIKEEVDDALRADFEPLHNACEQNEMAGPRWGLLLTVAAIVLALSSRETGFPIDSQMNNVALALKNTGMGMFVAILEASTLHRHVVPTVNRLADVATQILTLTTASDK